MQSSITVDLPQLVESTQQTDSILTISINADNQIFIDEQNCKLQELTRRIILLQKEMKRPILIRGDRESDLGVALTILDKLRQAGFKQVAFATEKDK